MRQFLFLVTLLFVSHHLFAQTPYTWTQKVPGSGHGNSLCVNPVNPNVIYGSPNTNVLWISRDRGNTWVQLGTTGVSGGISAIAVNPLDTNQILVSQGRGSSSRAMKSTNHGQTWTQTWAGGSFNSYGVPLEHKNYYPNLAYIMGSSRFYRSDDFGSTWTLVLEGAPFNAWCDAEISPLDDKVVLLGTTVGGIWKTTNGGASWTTKFNNGCSEIPMVAWSPSDPNVVYATRWGGCSSGMTKSTDGGETWTLISNVPSSMWSLAVDPRNPDYVVACNYGTNMYISRNGGQSWTLTNTGLSGSGNGALIVDTTRVFALNGGIFKLNVPENVSNASVRMVLSVNVNHGIDYHNDVPLVYPASVWVKGELPVLGQMQGNWTFGDTANGTLVRLYDNGTNGDMTPGDNIWTRSIIVPQGTDLGTFQYKFGAIYPGVDTANGGVQYLNNESAVNDFHEFEFTDADTVLTLPVNRWKTRGTVNATDVRFSVDLRGGSDFYSGVAISSVAQSVWLKGSLPILGRMGGNWTLADTASVMIRLHDDGTNGDAVAGDRIWSREMTFPENTRHGTFTYKYGVVYPGVENNNGGSAYLNNEAASHVYHQTVLAESALTLSASDIWLTRAGPTAQVTPASFQVALQQGDSAVQMMTISNTAEFGSGSLSYSLKGLDPAFEQITVFGSFSETFTGAGRDRGNVYFVEHRSTLTEIRSYLGISSPTSVYFFVYEGDTRTGTYRRVFQTSDVTSVGTKWYHSGPIEVDLLAGKYYYIGSSWMGSVTYGKAPDSTFSGPITTEFGELLTAQPVTLAGYPPSPLISGSQFGNSYAPYYQSIKVNTTSYLTVSQEEGVVSPEGNNEVLVRIRTAALTPGEYSPSFIVRTNDPAHSVVVVEGHLVVSPVVSARWNPSTPAEFALEQNYPNPFNPTTVVKYQIPVAGNVTVRILNVLGQEVRELDNGMYQPGYYEKIWNGRNAQGMSVSSGLYFYQLTVQDPSTGSLLYQQRRKMLLLK
jgi:hypothetical protein